MRRSSGTGGGHPPRPSSTAREERYYHRNGDDLSAESQSDDGDDNDPFFDLDSDNDETDHRAYLNDIIPPPLPLCEIGPDESSNPLPKTISGRGIRTVTHIVDKSPQGGELYDPLLSRFVNLSLCLSLSLFVSLSYCCLGIMAIG
jgi:hypothetical protein